jgi:hypothetical protein
MLLLYGFPAVLFEKFALPDALDEYRRHGVTTGGSTALYAMFLAEQRKRPGRKLIPTLRLLAGCGRGACPPTSCRNNWSCWTRCHATRHCARS